MNITDRFLNDIDELFKKEIPTRALERTRKSLLDYIAVTIAGAKINVKKLADYFSFINSEKGNCTLIGMNKKTTLKECVFLNGLNAHTLDLDDGTNVGIIHLGSPIFSVLIPLAEKYNISLDKMLKSAIAGYEASFTIAVSIQPKHKMLGYHATGTCGVLGIAIAAAYMLDFTYEERKNAFSIAAVSGAGMLKVLDDTSELKPYNVAKAALLGLESIHMAKAGFVGNHDVLGGNRGFLKMMTGEENVEIANILLNDTYAIEKTYTKPYAACRYCHPAIEASINLGKFININSINHINVVTYSLAVSGHDHVNIMGTSSAKMSIPYGVAVSLIYGKAGLNEYDDFYINNQQVIRLTRKVSVVSSSKFSKLFPDKQIAAVTIELNGGNKFTETVYFPKGEPENPINNEEFHNRFIELLRYTGINMVKITNIYNFVNQNDAKVKDLCDEISLLGGKEIESKN